MPGRHGPADVGPLYHRILLTGANGLVGQALVERLSEHPEVDLLATSREAKPRFSSGAGGYVAMDVTDPVQVRQVFDDFAPSAVIHCAAMSKVGDCEQDRDACWDVNVHATQRLARACRAHGSRMVLLSTDFIFDGEEGPYAENDRPGPVNYYGRTKLAAENAVRSTGHDRWAVVRTTLGFGAMEDVRRGNFATWLIERFTAGEQILVPTDQLRTPTYVLDLADGIVRLVLRHRSGVYHIAGRELMTTYDFARQVATHFGFDPDLVLPATTVEIHPDEPRPLRAGLLILKAESELGYRPRPLPEALDHLARRLGLPVASD